MSRNWTEMTIHARVARTLLSAAFDSGVGSGRQAERSLECDTRRIVGKTIGKKIKKWIKKTNKKDCQRLAQ